MFFPDRKTVEKIKVEFPEGTRVELIELNDPYRHLEPGLKGSVHCVDDTGTIHVNWDNGSHLGVVYGEDSCRKLDTVTTICNGKKEVWDSRKDAADFFFQALIGSEGSECERYIKIYTDLLKGMDICSDSEDA